MEYIGEHLLPGKIGHFAVLLSFVAALLSAISYFFATQKRNTAGQEQAEWLRIGRYAFGIHGVSVFVIIGCLFFILISKYYEYAYAQANVSDDLPFEYTFAAFWKDQQGSFILWAMWHVILGMVLLVRAGKLEAPVLTVIAAAQAIIMSMILGIYVGEHRIGAGTFDLLRDIVDAPVFKQADYLSKIQGAGLNPLLQNYWMTIHPPTLFLGFASTIVPFAYAIAALWTRDHVTWVKPALRWALFSGAILGLGILMGGVWAYEALSFGGYWAWDPVENSSLVPWLMLIAGIHTHLVANATGRSIRATYIFYLSSFLLVLYSTYMTRSGILGDTSAHAFTELGLGFQLVMFMALFFIWGLFLLVSRWKSIPGQEDEEGLQTREFWMFIGSLVLFFSAALMTGATSLPVFNKIIKFFNEDYIGAAIKDPISHHNRYQLWIAVFMGLFTGIAQLMRFQERNWDGYKRKFGIHVAASALIASVLTYLNTFSLNISAWQYFTLLFAAMFAVVANLDYLINFVKGNLKLGASALSHIGFGVLILGVMYTGLNKEWISQNAFAMEGLIEGMGDDGLQKNVLLMRDAPMPIKYPWKATYQTDTVVRQTRTFKVLFQQMDTLGNPFGEEFYVEPNVMYDRGFSKIVASNPSTKHYWNKDVFTLVSSLPKAELDKEFAKQQEDSVKYKPYNMALGDTVLLDAYYVIFDNITRSPEHKDYKSAPGDLAFGLDYRIGKRIPDGSAERKATAVMFVRPGEGGFSLNATVRDWQLRFRVRENTLEELFKQEDQLPFKVYKVKDGDSFTHNGFEFTLAGIDKEPNHPGYTRDEGDLAVGAILKVKTPTGASTELRPLYIVRGNKPFSIKDEVYNQGIHVRFSSIEPENELLVFSVADISPKTYKLPVDIAEDVPSSDYIVMEAIIFPGINLVWAGSLLMLLGLAIGFYNRRFRSRVAD